MFIWRTCKEALPTNQNLFTKKVVSEPLCPICLRFSETVTHVLWDCEAACDVWCNSSNKIQKISISKSYFKDLWLWIYPKLTISELVEFAYIAYYIWQRKNAMVFHKDFNHPNVVISKALYELQDFNGSLSSLQLFAPAGSHSF